MLFLGPRGALGGGSALIDSAIAGPERWLSCGSLVCLTVLTTEFVAVGGCRAIVWDASRARWREDVGEVTHSNSAYGLRSELKAVVVSGILVGVRPCREESVTIRSQVPTAFVVEFPDCSQLRVCVSVFGRPDNNANLRLSKFGVVLAQNVECLLGISSLPVLQRLHRFDRPSSL